MRTMLCGWLLAGLTTAAVSAQETAPRGPEVLAREIAAMTPAAHAWRAIPWRSCPLDALAEARKTHRPVLVWVFLGSPVDERC